MKELSAQRTIIKWVEAEGGYGKKWSSTYSVGVPDLILLLGGREHALVFAEVKIIKPTTLKFRRAVALTPRQHIELLRLRKQGVRAVVAVLVSGFGFAVLDDLGDVRAPLLVTHETPAVGWDNPAAVITALFGERQ